MPLATLLSRLTAAFLLGSLISTQVLADETDSPALKPYSASYTADMQRIPVSGKAGHTLAQNDDGSWQLTFDASMFVASMSESSHFELIDGQIRPLGYLYERKGLGRNRETRQVFDWAAGTVTGNHRDKVIDLATEPGLLDKTSYQLALQLDLMAGKENLHYRVVDGRSIDEYEFEITGTRQVETAVGRFDAVEVVRVRDADAKRQTTLWFARDWNYMLVRLQQIESDGQEYQIMLKEATLDGVAVRGN